MDPNNYNPHYLMLVDSTGVTVFRASMDALDQTELDSGLFFLENREGIVDDQSLLEDRFPLDFQDVPVDQMRRLEEFCKSHQSLLQRDSLCLHAEVAGTLSSSLIVIEPDNDEVRYRFAQGPPCEVDYQDFSIAAQFQRDLLNQWS